MTKLNSFNDFVGGEKKFSNPGPKPYIYVIKYIMGKDDYIDELKEYILNYQDDESDYEDSDSYDPFMKKLKFLAEEEDFDEIEEMILSHDTYSDEFLDYDSDDDDYEEKMYDKEYTIEDDSSDIIDENYDEILESVENSNLSEQLKDFLKIEIEFEDLGKDEKSEIDIEFEELGKNEDNENIDEIENVEDEKMYEEFEEEIKDKKRSKKYKRPYIKLNETDLSKEDQ